jgi:hypothetical protein
MVPKPGPAVGWKQDVVAHDCDAAEAFLSSDLTKVAEGKKLSPILVVSFDDGAEIADGYHRVSLAYALDPFGTVPLRLAGLSG